MTNIKIDKSWKDKLGWLFISPHMAKLSQFLKTEKVSGKRIYPLGGKIFNAFNLTPFGNVKIIILGQDPYHGSGQAHGLSFSVDYGTRPPPSLQNIFKELKSDLNLNHPGHGNLEGWARQGVLLLNSCLTVEEGKAGSHQGKGWEKFTDAVLKSVSNEKEHVIFILWGRKAQEKAKFIDRNKHLIIESVHPSPLSAYNGFFGSKPFSKANEYLKTNQLDIIDWQL